MPDPRFLNHFSAQSPVAGLGVPLPTDFGFAAWSDPPGMVVTSGAVAQAAGNLALRRFSIPGAMPISTVHVVIGTGGGTLTAAQCFAGVWDGNGVLIGLSADQSVQFTGVGLNSMALAPGPNGNGVDTPFIYAGFWWNGAGPGPFMLRRATADVAFTNGVVAVNLQAASALASAGPFTTAATVPNQLGVLTKNGSLNGPFWAAVS